MWHLCSSRGSSQTSAPSTSCSTTSPWHHTYAARLKRAPCSSMTSGSEVEFIHIDYFCLPLQSICTKFLEEKQNLERVNKTEFQHETRIILLSLQCRCVSTHMPFNLSESQLESQDSLTISYIQKYYFTEVCRLVVRCILLIGSTSQQGDCTPVCIH